MGYWSKLKGIWEREKEKVKDIMKIITILCIFYIILGPRSLGKVGEYTCRANSDCESGVCVRGVCRAEVPRCGDGFCDTGEDCSNCEVDCGACKLANGEPCTLNVECNSTICLHGFCRPTDPWNGDGWCDSGETCWTAPDDCGECRWI